jgi:hypothetical protein
MRQISRLPVMRAAFPVGDLPFSWVIEDNHSRRPST